MVLKDKDNLDNQEFTHENYDDKNLTKLRIGSTKFTKCSFTNVDMRDSSFIFCTYTPSQQYTINKSNHPSIHASSHAPIYPPIHPR
ncbi:MAG: hypothetical protein AAF413_03245, partial [Patescibacteria group bacterium]